MTVVEFGAIQGWHLKILRWTYRRFYPVLNHDDNHLAAIPKGIKHPFGTSWVPHDAGEKAVKIQRISLIASAKRDSAGRGYAPFEDKQDGLAPYKFSVVIENTQEPNYFTEKIVDAVLCETVPIYWGCPNIAEFFDPARIIKCENAQQLNAAILAADDAHFAAMAPALRKAKQQAVHWSDLEGRAARAVQATL